MTRLSSGTARRLAVAAAMFFAVVGLAACGDGVEARDDLSFDTIPDITVPDVSIPDVTVPPTDDTTDTTADEDTTTTEAAEPGDAAGGEDNPQQPGDLGDDPVLDGLADDCFGGDFSACDQLFFQSDADSAYEAYGDSCGGRNEPGGLCTVIYGDG